MLVSVANPSALASGFALSPSIAIKINTISLLTTDAGEVTSVFDVALDVWFDIAFVSTTGIAII